MSHSHNNGLKGRLTEGEALYGTMLVELHTPNVAAMLRVAGFDYMIVDCEHGAFDYAMVAALAAVGRGAGIGVIVRIPAVSRECILKYLELGAEGLLIPMVQSAAEVREAVQYSKYAPEGRRGVSTTRAHSGYDVPDLQAYMAAANARTLVLVQIESTDALARLDDIAAVPGLDGLIVGPNDLTQDMGIVNDYDHPRFRQALTDVARTAAAHGLASGIHSSDLRLLRDAAALGMRLCSWSSEAGMLLKSAREGLKRLKEQTEAPSPPVQQA